ncbi:BamA/OMP85 family outer membrane protein [Flavobacterium urocaniciphilum]|uniref:Beta-barrel assembly machine subunit BamA n=1 Tax=Flavobacterium urocaniciphilum TaxID=1299341 RepID=A0A1H9CJ99_9FLAO|nr:POTRA domain-containing protein [Flavobacterium urocaniciphilum]SEQ00773.1 Beta-barrel assembly machine subunit BamA [Flavobacterium urocaniciphilum]
MLKNKILFLFALLFLGNIIQAQEETTLQKGNEYTLAGIEVIGKVSYNEQTVITFAGLEIGSKIRVPGEEISNAVKKLWKLGLFNDVNFYVKKIEGNNIFLELELFELPKLNEVKIKGVRKGKKEDILKETELTKGKVVNDNLLTNTKNYIEKKFKKDGYYNAKATINTLADSTNSKVDMVIFIDRGNKVKINKINFVGNEQITDSKLKKAFKNTKEKRIYRLFKSSKYVKDKYKEDLTTLISKYKEKGYRDARIINEEVVYNKEKNKLDINVNLEEGRKHYFGDIRFLGNTVYSDQLLHSILGIQKGDVYNGVLLQKRIADDTQPDGEDITNLYQNNGYLWSNINPVEVKTENDTIDFEIRISEGPIAYFNNIIVKGNDKTNDRVIYRELRTRPGQKWNKDQVIRSIRELGQLGFFDAEAIRPEPINMDPAAGTVDLEWTVVEKGSSQVELQGGYGAGGFIGTLGLSFNNFSLKNILKKEAYRPLPMGDGQKMSLRLQGSNNFQVYSLSFTEPWLGGKKPISFFTSLSHSKQFLYDYNTRDVTRNKSFNISTITVGYGKRLKVPDDYFSLSNSVSFSYYDLNNYNTGLFTFGDGAARNLSFNSTLTRDSKGLDPIFPDRGSTFTVSAKFSLPYSAFNGIDYGNLKNLEQYKLKNKGNGYVNTNGNYVPSGAYIDQNGDQTFILSEAVADQSKIDQERFKWLEFYKIKFSGDWYTKIYKKFVLRARGEFGFLGAYNQDRGIIPFERFFVGGDGLANYSLDGREIIQLRGYPNNSLSSQNGGTVYNKYSMELRYPITMKQSAKIYAMSFLEAGSAFDNFKDFDPFKIQRSAGFGLRVFMPAFGLLGIDFAHGFDPVPGDVVKSGWQTHFIIGQQF